MSQRNATYDMLVTFMEAAEGEGLDPNDVVEGLAVFYVQLYRAAGWDEDSIVDHIADLVEGIVDGEGHPESDD